MSIQKYAANANLNKKKYNYGLMISQRSCFSAFNNYLSVLIIIIIFYARSWKRSSKKCGNDFYVNKFIKEIIKIKQTSESRGSYF